MSGRQTLPKLPDDPEAAKERRRFHRVPLDRPAELLSTALGRVGATLVDLSQSGCRVRTRARCQAGDHFVLRIGPFGARAVTVAWRQDETVGLAFAELLAWTVVTAIAFPEPVSA